MLDPPFAELYWKQFGGGSDVEDRRIMDAVAEGESRHHIGPQCRANAPLWGILKVAPRHCSTGNST